MEYLKSYLLYRDMLKSRTKDKGFYSLGDSIRLVQGAVNQSLFKLKSGGNSFNNNKNFDDLFKILQQLEHRRSMKLDTFMSNTRKGEIKVAQLRSNLNLHQGLVNYYSNNDQLYIIYLDQDTTIFFSIPQTQFPLIKAAVKEYRISIEKERKLKKENISSYVNAGRILYNALIGPFANRLQKIDDLVIIPNELLAPVPFEAFLSEPVKTSNINFRELPYLLNKVNIIYSFSCNVLSQNKNKIQNHFKNKSIGFWTNPELVEVNGLEVIEEAIRSNFGTINYKLFNYTEGGKKTFLENHHQFDILHLLLHASSSRVNRYDNRINFGYSENDIAYGFDFYKERFKAKLIVLSSCESATGTPQIGEGTFSLARSFINSGIPEVVAAQYLIPQTTTGLLMSQFYNYLGKGQRASCALHSAKIEYLKSVSRDRYAHPRFWAGMVVFN